MQPREVRRTVYRVLRPVLTYGEIYASVIDKGILYCVDGCSRDTAYASIVLSGQFWIEADDQLESIIIQVEDLTIPNKQRSYITDIENNELDSYVLGDLTARPSEYTLEPLSTPESSSVPEPIHGESPRVDSLSYNESRVHLNLTEPVRVIAENMADVGINVRLTDGTIGIGACVDPCNGSQASLIFDVPGLTPDAVAMSFSFTNSAHIHDLFGMPVEPDFEQITLSQIPKILYMEVFADEIGEPTDWIRIEFQFTQLVVQHGTRSYLTTEEGTLIHCQWCIYGPGTNDSYFYFYQSREDFKSSPIDIEGLTVTEFTIENGMFLSKTGQEADVSFEPFLIDPGWVKVIDD